MDSAYLTWLLVLLCGAALGLFLSPRTVVLVSIWLFVAAVAGLIGSAALGYERAAFLLGIASIAVPVLGAVTATGAAVSARLRRPRSR